MDQKRDTYATFSPRAPAAALDTGTAVSALYNECSTGDGVSLSSFCHLVAHQRLLSWDFDHLSSLKTFRLQTGVPQHAEDTLDTQLIDSKQLRQALQALAVEFYGAHYGLKASSGLDRQTSNLSGEGGERRNSGSRPGFAMEALYKIQALQDLLRDVSVRNADVSFQLNGVCPKRTAFFDEQVISAAYEYESIMRKLFLQYETEVEGQALAPVEDRLQRTISARSLYRLARSLRLVPDCMASGDFHELVGELYICGPKAPEKRYFKELTMLQSDEEPDVTWVQPAVGSMPGEPRFSFPDVMELFTLAALHTSPQLYNELSQDRVERIHEIFKDLLRLPTGEVEVNAEEFLQVVSGYLDAAKDKEPSNLVEIWAALDSELPKLAPKKDPYIPQPPAQVLEKLPPQPLTSEQRTDESQRKNPFGRAAAGGKKKGKKKAKVKQPKWREYFYGNVPVHWNQVQWLGKRPELARPEVPPMWQTDSKVAMLKNLDDHIGRHRDESQAANMPASGWVLRLQLIDEPLKAPSCPQSEEVSTLMETALTSRRLKQYDAAIALLLRARKLWATIEARGSVPQEWQDVQSLIPAPSPWTTGARSSRATFPHLAARREAEFRKKNTALSQEMDVDAREQAAEVEEAPKHPYVKSKTDIFLPGGHLNTQLAKHHTEGELLVRRVLSRNLEGSEGGKTPQSARGRTPAGSRTPSHSAGSANRRYNPKNDFHSAMGDGDEDLDLLPPQATVFFFCELASLHSALQEDELSGLLLWRALGSCKRLSPYDANAAMVWSGLGRVAFYSGSFEAAARLYMRARSIREKALGGDTIDTATAYNNLACCLAALDRPVEAVAFTELSVEILKELAGEDHPRTHTAMRNLGKVRTAPKKIAMEAPYLYSLPLRDFTRALRSGRKKKKKKGRSKSGSSSRSSKSAKSRK